MKQPIHAVLAWLPFRSAWSLARTLATRANAERDARSFQTAAALYEEAIRLAPGATRFHIQCGHMHKESGDFESAERHYLLAAERLPRDADLALQLGHFYKVAGRIDDAADAYSRALSLRPGWIEAIEEVARAGGAAAVHEALDKPLVAEILPVDTRASSGAMREGIHVLRLGRARARTRGTVRRVLRGIEAIRGFVISAHPISHISLLIDGEQLRHEHLQTHKLGSGQYKGVFNIWQDFRGVQRGPKLIELRALDSRMRRRSYRIMLDVVDPVDEADHPDSDAIVAVPRAATGTIDDAINHRASMVRRAARSVLPPDVSSILVQRVDQLGDLACSVPALRRLRALFPDARIVLLATRANADLAQTLGMIDAVVIAPFAEQVADGHKSMAAADQVALRETLAAYDFDLAIDLGETGTSRPLLALSGARFLYGFKGREFPWLDAAFDFETHDPGNGHEQLAHPRKLVAMIDGLVALQPLPGSDIPQPRRSDYIVLHAGARLAYSRWPGFAPLISLLLARTPYRVVLMTDQPPADLPVSERLRIETGLMPFDQFDELIAGAGLFIGNDSGPKHLAALRETPTISLHMPRVNWSEWGQIGDGLIISRRVPCAGCGIGKDPEDCGKDYVCLRAISPEEVLEAALSLLPQG